MTTGSLWKNILLFSLPLMGSQVLEVLFNLSDVAVVGRFADYLALGAVGSTTLLVTLFTGILIGMGAGVNVRVAHELGAGNKRYRRNDPYIASSLCHCRSSGLYHLSAFLRADADHDEHKTGTDRPGYFIYEDLLSGYAGHGCIQFWKRCFKCPRRYKATADLSLYCRCNQRSSEPVFRYCLSYGCRRCCNCKCTLLYVSASLVMIHLLQIKDECQVSLQKLRLHPKACKAVLLLGIPTGLQNGIFAIANLFVQTGVNSFDAVMVSGNAAAANADALIYNVMFSFYTACASFIGQNWGAGNKKRMLKSYGISLTYAFVAGAILGGLLLTFGPQFLSLFATEPAVINAGMQRIRIMGFCYAFSCFMDGSIAASRGIGKVFRQRSLLSLAPAYSVLSGSIRYLHISRQFRHCIFCISSHGELQDLQKYCSLL